MKILALIPARYASTRFAGKPLALIGGRPMIEHVYERASDVFEHCYVATDDERISSVVSGFGGRVVMTSTEHRSGTDRCREAMQNIGGQWDVVINIQGDEPFIASEQLQQVASLFDDPQTDIATLVKPFEDGEDIFNPNSPKVVLSQGGFALYFSRSVIPYLRGTEAEKWSAKHQYFKHIGLYGYRAEVLKAITEQPAGILETAESLEQLRWLENGYRIKTAITTLSSYAIDTPEDLARLTLSGTADQGVGERA